MPCTKPFAIDIDDVIADLSEVLHPCLSKRYSNITPVDQWSDFNLAKMFGFNYRSFLEHIIEDNLLLTANPIAGSVQALKMIKDSGAQIVLITSRGYHPNAMEVTKQWLDMHDIPYDDLIIVQEGETKAQASVNKYPNGFQYMIDDNVFNLKHMKDANLTRKTVLIDRPWNQSEYDYKIGSSRFKSLTCFVNSLAIEARRNSVYQPDSMQMAL